MRWILLCALALVTLPWLFGCAAAQESFAEREIVKRAPNIIGPADRYTADVKGLKETSADKVTVNGTRVRPTSTPGLVIDSLVLTLRGVQFQRDPFLITNIDQAAFTARLTDRAVNDYLKSRQTATSTVQNVQLTFTPTEVRAQGTLVTAGQAVAFTTAGTVQPEGPLLNFTPRELSLGGVTVPANVLQQFTGALNPLVDLRGLRITPQVQQIALSSGAVTISGTADVRSLINSP